MPETTGTTTEETPGGGGENTQVEDTGTDTATQAEGSTGGDKRFTQADIDRIVKDRLAAEKQRQKRAAEEAQKPELERLRSELDTTRAELRARDARDAVIAEASRGKQAARNPQAVYRLVKDDLTFDEDGKPTNAADVLAQARRDYPELFNSQTGSGDGGAGRERQQGLSFNDLIRQRAGAG